MQGTALTHNDYVRMSLASDIAPLELKYYPIVNCETGFPVAYRTKTTIHSLLLGEMNEDDYTYVSDERPCGQELLKHNIRHIGSALNKFAAAGRNVEFVSVRCPSELVENAELYDVILGVLQNNPSINPRKVCLEFPASLLERDTQRAHTAILDMKLLKVRTAIVGCGAEDFPISKLLSVTPDFAVLDPSATAYAGSRNKPQLLPSLVSYIMSMGIRAIAEGSDEERRSMRGSDCSGFLIKDAAGLSLEEAVAQKEEDA